MAQSKVLKGLKAELEKMRGEWPVIVHNSKGTITYRWLVALAQGTIKDPGVSKIEALCRALGRPLVW